MTAMGQKRSNFPRGIDEALGVDPRPSLAARNHGPLPEALPFFPWAGTLRRQSASGTGLASKWKLADSYNQSRFVPHFFE
jgi:hypothetical protein